MTDNLSENKTDVCLLTKYLIKYWLTHILKRNIHPLTMMVNRPVMVSLFGSGRLLVLGGWF